MEASLKEIRDLLEEDEVQEQKLQELLGKVPPAPGSPPGLAEVSKECSKYLELHEKASFTNTELHRAMNLHLGNLRLLGGPLEQVRAALPTPTLSEGESCPGGLGCVPLCPLRGLAVPPGWGRQGCPPGGPRVSSGTGTVRVSGVGVCPQWNVQRGRAVWGQRGQRLSQAGRGSADPTPRGPGIRPAADPAPPAEDKQVLQNLKRILAKVQEMRDQRTSLEQQLREMIQKDDITTSLVTTDRSEMKVGLGTPPCPAQGPLCLPAPRTLPCPGRSSLRSS